MRDNVRELAEELPEHQSNRGNEFRNLDVDEREPLANVLVRARSQAEAGELKTGEYTVEMIRKRCEFFYYAGQLDIDFNEAEKIWWSIVHDNASPVDRVKLV